MPSVHFQICPKFQFHKGTIRTLSPTADSTVRLYFNSIKVRLELLLLLPLLPCLPYFNSIKVRLEQTTQTVVNKQQRFQFHKGTIRTSYAGQPALHNSHFNSIKVRLELQYFFFSIIYLVDFNSIKVRLEPDGTTYDYSLRKFQFHKVTIRTICQCANASRLRYFNSIKVRLEPLSYKLLKLLG